MNRTERNQIVLQNLPLVGYLVADARTRTPHLPWDDMVSAGSEALVRAAESYDPSRGVPFGTFARHRIKGALADTLRSIDWAGRSTRAKISEFRKINEALTAALGREPGVEEVAGAMGVNTATAEGVMADAARTLEALEDADAERLRSVVSTPEEAVLAREQQVHMAAAVAELPEKMRFIVEEVYLRERPVKEVAEELGVTHSAVSQQKSEALRLLREGLTVHDGGKADHAESSRRGAYLSAVAGRTHGGITRFSPRPMAVLGAA